MTYLRTAKNKERELDTYFVRHTQKLDIDSASRDRLWNENRIAIHYPEPRDGKRETNDNESLSLDDYAPGRSGPRTVMASLVALAENGGYVCAEYFPDGRVKIGQVRSGSKIELVKCKWGSEPRVAVLKTLCLDNSRVLKPSETAFVLAGRPQQGTISRWPGCANRVKDIVEGSHAAVDLDNLHHYEQEIMCSEFLRLPRATELGLPRLANLLVPVGKTMKDADIFGVTTDGNIIVCQVTWYDEAASESKRIALTKYIESGKSVAVHFCKSDSSKLMDGIHVFPLQQVFAEFVATAFGKLWLSAIRRK